MLFSDHDSTVKPVEFLWRMVVHVLTTTESVEGSLMFSKYILTIAKPFVALQWFKKAALTTQSLLRDCRCLERHF